MTDIYDCSPLSIDSYVGDGTSSGGSSTTIVRKSNKMVILLEVTSSDNACNLPIDSEIGDLLEIYVISGPATAWIYAPSGETFVLTEASVSSIGDAGLFRKIASDKWARLKGT